MGTVLAHLVAGAAVIGLGRWLHWPGWSTAAALAVCAIAWFLARDPTRVLAVLVVATPCPLILATPIAMIGGKVPRANDSSGPQRARRPAHAPARTALHRPARCGSAPRDCPRGRTRIPPLGAPAV